MTACRTMTATSCGDRSGSPHPPTLHPPIAHGSPAIAMLCCCRWWRLLRARWRCLFSILPWLYFARDRSRFLLLVCGGKFRRATEEACHICHVVAGALFAGGGGDCLGCQRVVESEALAGLPGCFRRDVALRCFVLAHTVPHLLVVTFPAPYSTHECSS